MPFFDNLTVFFLGILWITVSGYEVPTPAVELLYPAGFRVSIPDEPGIEFFGLHANLNKPIAVRGKAQVVFEKNVPKDGRWSYTNTESTMQPYDEFNYCIYVQANGTIQTYIGQFKPLPKDGLISPSFKESLAIAEVTEEPGAQNSSDSTCEPSVTTVRGELQPCKYRLVFEEQFDNDLNSQERISENRTWWSREILMPLDPDYEFSAYRELHKNVEVENGVLKIIPLITDAEYGENAVMFGNLDLGESCTGSLRAECSRRATGFNILHPVTSARITTKQGFHFRYGKVEIRAKFPKGDWLYPELWLEPKYKTYGAGYSSGRVVLAMSRGNLVLRRVISAQDEFGASVLEFGLRTGLNDNITENIQTGRKVVGSWNDAFATYTTIWDESGFRFKVDGQEVGRIEAVPGGWLDTRWFPVDAKNTTKSNMRPYDNEFYITLGLGVGGIRAFPDWTWNPSYLKPWRNRAAKAMLHFWRERNSWLPTWKNESGVIDANLQIDYVKVWTV